MHVAFLVFTPPELFTLATAATLPLLPFLSPLLLPESSSLAKMIRLQEQACTAAPTPGSSCARSSSAPLTHNARSYLHTGTDPTLALRTFRLCATMSWNSANPPTIGLLCTTLNVRSVASHWTEADKEKFLIEVKQNGLETLADKIGTKSEQEVDFFLALLHEHLGRQYLQAFINAQPTNQAWAKRNTLMAKLLESVMDGRFEGHVQRLLTNVTSTDPDALFAEGGGGAETRKMGGVGRRRAAAPVPKKGYTKRKREEQAKEEAAKKRAKNKKTTVKAGGEEGEEEEKDEEENAQEQPEPDALASAPATTEQEKGQVVGGVEEEEEDEEVVEAGVYDWENEDDWEPVAAVAAVGPMEETKQNVEEEGQKVG